MKISQLPLICLGLTALDAPSALSADLIPQGPQAKASAGAAHTTVTGAMALFYNPANIGISASSQIDYDLSLASYSYEYQHTDRGKFKPVVISDQAPPVSLGATTKLSETLTMGISLFPTGAGSKLIVTDIPLYLGDGLYQLADVELISSGSKMVIGSSYRLAPWVLMGLSITRIQEKSDTSVFKAGEIYPFLRTISDGVFYRPTLGITTQTPFKGFLIGFSLSPMLVKKYRGKFLFDLTGDDQAQGNLIFHPARQVDVLPQTTGLGVMWREGPWGLFTELVYEQWQEAQTRVTRGLPIASPKQDLKNTLNSYLGGSYKVGDHEIKASYGYQPSNLGDGLKYVKSTSTLLTENTQQKEPEDLTLLQDQESAQTKVEGMTFGNISGISRSVFALGWQKSFDFLGSTNAKVPGYGSATLYSMSGTRKVPPGFSQEGTYKVNIKMITLGGSYRF